MGAEDLVERYEREVLPIMVNYCYDCHGDGSKEGHLALDDYGKIEEMIADREQWKRIRDHIDFRLMPPPDEYAPNPEERAKVVSWIDEAVFPVDRENPDPGHVMTRRLNLAEYQNTIRDLLGVEVDVHELLPVDDSGYGFDNIGDVLTLSPLHMERYLEAADKALGVALDYSPDKVPKVQVELDQIAGNALRDGAGVIFPSNAEASVEQASLGAGRYKITIIAKADEVGDEAAKMELKINGQSVRVWDVKRENGWRYRAEFELGAEENFNIAVSFLNDFWDSSAADGKNDRNLYVRKIFVVGPMDGAPAKPKASYRAIFTERQEGQSDEGYMLAVLKPFMARAFRRPVLEGEAERYGVFLEQARAQGETVEFAIRQALGAVMVSPYFLFRDEAGAGETIGEKALIGEHALAARLSYFLWSSMPDERLQELADRGVLRQNLAAEISRMIADEKSEQFVKNFAGQWLQLRDMEAVTPNKWRFGELDGALWGDMRSETELLFQQIMKENLPMGLLLSADYTFINGRLARHYGIEGVEGNEFRKISLAGTPRRGLLGQGSFLTLTSHSTRTSPVLRGKYVLENLFDTPPPPAPPNVPSLGGDRRGGNRDVSLRQELEAHRKNPNCASCHALMDPIGFGLENFDGVGRWRENDRGKPLDTAATLVTGQGFTNSAEMLDVFLRDYQEKFARAVAVKMLTYSLGRGLEFYDRPAVDEIVLKAGKDSGRFVSYVTAVVESVPFQYRRK